jgi:hypothetical protein
MTRRRRLVWVKENSNMIAGKIHVVCVSLVWSAAFFSSAEEPAKLTLVRSDTGVELSWPATLQGQDGSIIRPYFELQRSTDLLHWQPIGERLRAAAPPLGQSLSAPLDLGEPRAFYRLLSVAPLASAGLGSGGAEVFGYGAAFGQELQRIGQISPDQFAAMFPSPTNYLPGISWDPIKAQFWDEFNADPAIVNSNKSWGDPGYRYTDYRLNTPELARFKTNGFVVSERLGSDSFAGAFYNLWHNDLPVFISCDALLQAWHRSYDAMLEELEETYLFNSVQQMLEGMASNLPQAWTAAGAGVLKDSLLDADYFLAVARSLLAGTNILVPSALGQDARVAETLADVQALQMITKTNFLGQCRTVDFSQFKVRGHYTHSERLGRYFRCVMWLGRTDFAVAGGPFDRGCGLVDASPRELGTAIVFWNLLNRADQFATWHDFDRLIQAFVGWTDSMNFAQLGGLLSGAGIKSLSDVKDLATLEQLQSCILKGELGIQNIRSDYFVSPIGGQIQLPRSFLVFGQKFVPDSWAFSQNVYDSILWVDNGQTNKVQRRVPGALDTAFAVLGNNQVIPELSAQMKGQFADSDRPHAMVWRDGKSYQHNLAAVRAVMDGQTADAWASNIYMSWLVSLRELSAPTVESKYPEAMRTRAWTLKTLNTQLASWAQLRHDTILYAKQSYTGGDSCVYPTGFVEPRVEFWQRLRAAATRAADLISSLPYTGTYILVTNQIQTDPLTGEQVQISTTNSIPMATIQSNQVNHLRRFATTLTALETLVNKELAQQCFTGADVQFIDSLMEDRGRVGGCGGYWKYSGWYPQLFYRTIYWTDDRQFHQTYGAGASDALVADVHTDVPDQWVGDPGSVLHEAVGPVNLLMIAVDNGTDHFVCAGPVLSHYEFEVIGAPRRISDEEWRDIRWGNFPDDVHPSSVEGLAPPVWAQSYLVPVP